MTRLAGPIHLVGHEARDGRGGFRKVADLSAVAAEGAEVRRVDEVAVSTNLVAGTVRGLHLQCAPYAQAKTVFVTTGAVWDVIVDLRPESATYGQWESTELSAENNQSLFVPAGFAHGFQTLTDNATVIYLMRGSYHPTAARTIRWDDPDLGIDWPLAPTAISEADAQAAGLAAYTVDQSEAAR